MRRAAIPNAYIDQKFFFRKHVAPLEGTESPIGSSPLTSHVDLTSLDQLKPKFCDASTLSPADMYEEMTMAEIFNGKCCYFPGLVPLVYAYLHYIDCDTETFSRLDQYLKFLSL